MSRRIDNIARMLDGFNETFEGYGSPFQAKSYTFGALYDPERFELIPRKDITDRRLKELEEDIATMERNKESTAKYYEKAIDRLMKEKDKLTQQRKIENK